MNTLGRAELVRRIAVLAAIYVGVARLALMMHAVGGFATLVWPPTGIALAALLIFGRELWPGVAIGAFAVNLWNGAPLLAALGIAGGNTIEALFGAWMLREVAGLRGAFDRLRHAIGLIVFAALLGSLLSATIGVESLLLTGALPQAWLAKTWRAWWLGDALGALVMAPLLLSWYGDARLARSPARIAEVAALSVGLVAVSVFVFCGPPAAIEDSAVRHTYLVFPVLFFAALRFGLRGATTANFAVSAIAVVGTMLGLGPFVRDTIVHSLVTLQAFMAVVAVTALVLGAAISERSRAVQMRDEFLALVSHDLKSPLGAIQMSAALVARTVLAESGDPRLRRHVELVGRGTARMSHLIRDLLDAAAIDAGHLSLDPKEGDARPLVDETILGASPAAEEKGQRLLADTPGEAVPIVCDRARLEQVLANLIGNAVKFTPAGGAITVRLRAQEGAAHFSVTDTGAGIEPDQVRLVFDRYWRGKPGAAEGTGLGLFIAKGIVESHGGRIWASSEVGVGSAFHFTIPLAGRADAFEARGERSFDRNSHA